MTLPAPSPPPRRLSPVNLRAAPARVRLGNGDGARRTWRYLATSIGGTAFSELVLVLLYASGALGASAAAAAAGMAGALPGYLLSRYWVWPGADRTRMARQVLSYWLITLATLAAATGVTAFASARAPSGRLARDVVVAAAYIGTYGALWVVKYALLHFIVFRAPEPVALSDAVLPRQP